MIYRYVRDIRELQLVGGFAVVVTWFNKVPKGQEAKARSETRPLYAGKLIRTHTHTHAHTQTQTYKQTQTTHARRHRQTHTHTHV